MKVITLKNILLFLIPFAGILVFTVILKFFELEDKLRLPIYQGLLSYFALFQISFQFSRNGSAILSSNYFFALAFLLTIPFVFYGMHHDNLLTLISFEIIIFSCAAISLIYSLALNQKWFLFSQFLISIFLPWILIANDICLLFISFFIILLLVKIRNENKIYLPSYSHSNIFKNIASAALMQSIYFLLPLGDVYISDDLGHDIYINYTLTNKYILGITNFFFSFIHYEILFNKDLFSTNFIKYIFYPCIICYALLMLFPIKYQLVISLFIIATIINLVSLLTKKLLVKNISIFTSLIGIASLLLYGAGLYLVKSYFQVNLLIFISLIFLVLSIHLFALLYVNSLEHIES
jgi:hypothetical protein